MKLIAPARAALLLTLRGWTAAGPMKASQDY
jgi:hypothetical protein